MNYIGKTLSLIAYLILFSSSIVSAEEHATILKQAKILSTQINKDNLINDVAWLSDDARLGRASGTHAADEVAQWLIKRFEKIRLENFTKLGLKNFIHDFEYHVYDDAGVEHPAFSKNIIGIIPGANKSPEYLIVSAHYDHLGVEDELIYNGADDNATGVAAMLEIARVISEFSMQPDKTIVFVSFSAEEIGLHGSWNFCNAAHENNLAHSMTALNLEMFGPVKNSPMFVHLWEQQTHTTQPIIQAVKQASDALNVEMMTTADIDPGSDALQLLECEIAATTIDVSGGSEFEKYHPYYHSPDDKLSNIDRENFHTAVQVSAMSVWLLAN